MAALKVVDTMPPRPLVWISGYPGCGKTSAGDYLEKYFGYYHIDVDADFMMPRFKDGKPDMDDPALAGYMKSWRAFFSGGVAEASDFGSFLDLIVDKVAEVRKRDPTQRVVISQGMHRAGRDYFASRMRETEGLEPFFIGLAASLDKKCSRWRVKQDMMCPAMEGKTHEESFKARTGLELTEENFAQDWRQTNSERIKVMHLMDVDADEISGLRGANVSVDAGDDQVFPMLKLLCHASSVLCAEGDLADINAFLAESGKKLELFKDFKKG